MTSITTPETSPETSLAPARAHQPKGYMPQLDGLRAIAVISVLVHHFLPESFLLNEFKIGPLAVRFFFVLSGFLITGILLRYKQKIQSASDTQEIIKSFYLRRFVRTFPAYYLLLFITLVIGYSTVSQSFFWHFFYLSNFYYSFAPFDELLPHLWSLAVEEQFYVFWPIAILFCPIQHLSKLIYGTIAAGVLFRFGMVASGLGNSIAEYILPFSCLDSLCLGSLLAYSSTRGYSSASAKTTLLRFCLWIGTPLFVCLNLLEDQFHAVVTSTQFSALGNPSLAAFAPLSASFFFVWVVHAASIGFRGSLGTVLQSKSFLYLGKISYGIYLYHLLVGYLFTKVVVSLGFPLPTTAIGEAALFAIKSSLSILVAALSWSLVEQPINQFKSHFPYLKREQKAPSNGPSNGQLEDGAIVVNQLGKRFSRYRADKPVTLMETALSGFQRLQAVDAFWALREVSFTVAPGEMLGVIGHNGAGKSTLLQILGKVAHPTEGNVVLRGHVGALLDLGAGFHGDLSGRENVFITAIVAGLPRAEVARRLDAMIEFAELEAFIDNPVRTYSSGMMMRLAFAVAVHTDPDILLVDEFLSVGDLSFQAKCLNRILEMKAKGCAIVLVSHDVSQIERLCDHALWLKQGQIVAYGEPAVVAGQYTMEMRSQTQQRTAARPDQLTKLGTELKVNENRFGSLEVEITDVELSPTTHLNSGEPLTIEIHYRAHQAISNPIFGVNITTVEGEACLKTDTRSQQLEITEISHQGSVQLQLERLDLGSGLYFIDIGIYEANWEYAYDFHWHVYPITVKSKVSGTGILHPPLRWLIKASAPISPR